MELICVISQMISILTSNDPIFKQKITSNDPDSDLDSQPPSNSDSDSDSELISQPPSNFLSLSSQLISLVSSMDLELESESEFISLIKNLLSVGNSISDSGPESHFVSLVTDMISRIRSIESDPDLMEDPNLELASSCRSALCLIDTMDSYSELKLLLHQIINLVIGFTNFEEAKQKAKQEAMQEAEPEMESKLISLITQLMSLGVIVSLQNYTFPQFKSLIVQIISLVRSTDLDSLPKPESELMSLTNKSVSVFKSMSYLSLRFHERKVISGISDIYSSHVNSRDSDVDLYYKSFVLDVDTTLKFEPMSELISIIHQIFYLVISLNPELGKLISLCPQVQVGLENQKFHVTEKIWRSDNLSCFPLNWEQVWLTGGNDDTHFLCRGCNGKNHKEHEKAPLEVKHLLHPKHSLSLVSLKGKATRECYCCDEDLKEFFYYCIACDSAMNVACVEKPPVLYRDHPRWHEHKLSLFPRQASLTCNLCALASSGSPIYMCPPCDFVVHLRCINLPRVIRISRHLHRLSFTPSFDQGDWSCGICRRKINNDYGGYSCIKDDCSYVAHSRCATQRNVWDGVDLEGVPEEVEEEVVEPFVRISDGVILHFSHQQHYLRLDENTSRNYVEDNLCQACIMPIYFGNLYACLHEECDYILHEECAKLSCKLHHPIHPHQLTLVGGHGHGSLMDAKKFCSACPRRCMAGFFYECKFECQFKVHVQCATISEPLVHGSHNHPLFLTSKPGEQRICSVCKKSRSASEETFNCIESDFSLCFGCATLPQEVRYKHDKHILTLSYGKETSTLAEYWCEVCEAKLDPKKGFYRCDEYCCVTLHIKCLMGKDLYMKPGSSLDYYGEETCVLPNYQHMSRPFCSKCKKRCLYKIVFRLESGSIYCSLNCILKV